jgi:phosphomannomutase
VACASVLGQDNGYKLYGADAIQIISPMDKRVAEAIEQCLAPQQAYDYSDAAVRAHPLCLDVTEATLDAYLQDVSARLCRHRAENPQAPIKVVYTAM